MVRRKKKSSRKRTIRLYPTDPVMRHTYDAREMWERERRRMHPAYYSEPPVYSWAEKQRLLKEIELNELYGHISHPEANELKKRVRRGY